ncbi:uncharacterized protein LOC143041435 [Oratosquilla oratoria]|uniref:uncharacterized protein LOC143041435 n=1 Tax=Oratosquilla oratoria TaxID=337810 RepID=UPI003F772439
MGSPISVVVAEVVMQQFEAELLRTVSPSLKLWVMYVDDVFAVMQDKDIDPFFTRLNSLEPAIQFSMELEVNGVLPFLDILVSREGDHLETSIYRKPTYTDRLLGYDSYHKDCHKRSPIRTLWNRADKICSTTDAVRAEKRHLRDVFRANGYPNRTTREWTRTRRTETQYPHTGHRVIIPYIKGVSEAGVVYSIGCLDCDADYRGETQKKLATRIEEHKWAVKRKDVASALYKHMNESQHSID